MGFPSLFWLYVVVSVGRKQVRQAKADFQFDGVPWVESLTEGEFVRQPSPDSSLLDAVSLVQGRHPFVLHCDGAGCEEHAAIAAVKKKANHSGALSSAVPRNLTQLRDFMLSFVDMLGGEEDIHKSHHGDVDKAASKAKKKRTNSAFWIVLGVLIFLLVSAYLMVRMLRVPKQRRGKDSAKGEKERPHKVPSPESPAKSESSGKKVSWKSSSGEDRRLQNQPLLQQPPKRRPRPASLLPDFDVGQDGLGSQSLPLASGPVGSSPHLQPPQAPMPSPLSPGLTTQRRQGARTSFLSNFDGTGSCLLEEHNTNPHQLIHVPQQPHAVPSLAVPQTPMVAEDVKLIQQLQVPDVAPTPSAAANASSRKRLSAALLDSFMGMAGLQSRTFPARASTTSSVGSSRQAHRSDSSSSAGLSTSFTMWTTPVPGEVQEERNSHRSSGSSSGKLGQGLTRVNSDPSQKDAVRFIVACQELSTVSQAGGRVDVTKWNGSPCWHCEVRVSSTSAKTIQTIQVQDAHTPRGLTVRPLELDHLIGGRTFHISDENGKHVGNLRFTELGATLFGPDGSRLLELRQEAAGVQITVYAADGSFAGRFCTKGHGDATHLEFHVETGNDIALVLGTAFTLAVSKMRPA